MNEMKEITKTTRQAEQNPLPWLVTPVSHPHAPPPPVLAKVALSAGPSCLLQTSPGRLVLTLLLLEMSSS